MSKIINTEQITTEVARLCIEANHTLSDDIRKAFVENLKTEKSQLGKNIINTIIDNVDISNDEEVPMCQDTGFTVIFVELGQQLTIEGKNLTEAINDGVRLGYSKGFLRKSVVKDPINRINTNDNTPAVIHYDIVEGEKIKITVAPKGFGSENMGTLKMLTPSSGIKGVMDFVVDSVRIGGANACPPLIVGVGVGGTMEKAALIAKKSLLREVDSRNADDYWAGIENELLIRINKLGIGPAGLGGTTTALGVNIETFPTHIAGLPVAVNIGCHVTRHLSCEL
jgi:fumarate hydratase subunit alpha